MWQFWSLTSSVHGFHLSRAQTVLNLNKLAVSYNSFWACLQDFLCQMYILCRKKKICNLPSSLESLTVTCTISLSHYHHKVCNSSNNDDNKSICFIQFLLMPNALYNYDTHIHHRPYKEHINTNSSSKFLMHSCIIVKQELINLYTCNVQQVNSVDSYLTFFRQ